MRFLNHISLRSIDRPAAGEAADCSRLFALNARVGGLRRQLRGGSGFRLWKPDIFYYMFVLVGAVLFALAAFGSRNHPWGIIVAGIVLGLLCLLPPRIKNRSRYWTRIILPNRRLEGQIAPLLVEIDQLRTSLVRHLENLLEPVASENSESPLRWTCRSVSDLADDLNRQGHSVSELIVAQLLIELGYSFPCTLEIDGFSGETDRNARFECINQEVMRFLADSQPVFSIDTRRGKFPTDFRNGEGLLSPENDPRAARVRDFLTRELGRATPYGVNEPETSAVAAHAADMDPDTSASALESIASWWQSVGRGVYPHAHRVLITAGAGESNAPRVRLWKSELQKLSDRTGLRIVVCDMPPGVARWNKVEHLLFRTVNQNEHKGASYDVIIHLIAAEEENGVAPSAIGIRSPGNTGPINTSPSDWNYEILPRPPRSDGPLIGSGTGTISQYRDPGEKHGIALDRADSVPFDRLGRSSLQRP